MYEGGEAPEARTEQIAKVMELIANFYVDGNELHGKVQDFLTEHAGKFPNDFSVD